MRVRTPVLKLFGALFSVVSLWLAAPACSGASSTTNCVADQSTPLPAYAVTVSIKDESGSTVPNATVTMGDLKWTDASGNIAVTNLSGASLLFVSAPGFLEEPVIVARRDAGTTQSVRLLSDKGGTRWTMHSVGDVMLGRRYEVPTSGAPLIPIDGQEKGSRAVVAPIAKLYSMADVRTLNLETVVSDRDERTKYPGKRFILRSRPGALAALADLKTSVAALANNHSRDYLDVGISDTLAALANAKISHVGASVEDVEQTPFSMNVRGTPVSVLAWTTVEGSFVNDSYPKASEKVPANLEPQEVFQYADRNWGFSGKTWTVTPAPRRIHTAWDLFSAQESKLERADQVGAWNSLMETYPELQDWVARRGHGGAALWNRTFAQAQIQKESAKGGVVLVQFHAGFQFQEAGSANVQKIAREAIDAGADIVVAHHPHVLQGFEWYRGKLIAYSLGNFLFDQDFLSTFSSTILRTVWEGKTLVEARAIPIELDAYMPAPAAGVSGDNTLYRLWERSKMRASSDRGDDGAIRPFVNLLPAESLETELRFEHGTARLTNTAPATKTELVTLVAGETKILSMKGLVDPRLASPNEGVLVGREMFGWGRFEDEVVNASPIGDTHWDEFTCEKGIISENSLEPDPATATLLGQSFLRLRRSAQSSQRVVMRPVARVPFFRHRLFPGVDSKVAVDPDATYTFRVRARMTGYAPASIKMDLFYFDDTDPTEDPTSEVVDSIEWTLPLELSDAPPWKDISFDVPADKLGASSRANMALFYVRLEPGKATLDVDDIELIEWRVASKMPDRWGRYTHVRNTGSSPVSLPVPYLPAAD
ncbi:MAG: CapA family protein [Polyangiaceae bacterium]|nr:CapA family protein [Polyangiaceae bacterium]